MIPNLLEETERFTVLPDGKAERFVRWFQCNEAGLDVRRVAFARFLAQRGTLSEEVPKRRWNLWS